MVIPVLSRHLSLMASFLIQQHLKKYKHHEMFSRQMQEVPTVCKSLKVKGKALHLDPGYKKPWVELPRACVLHLR